MRKSELDTRNLKLETRKNITAMRSEENKDLSACLRATHRQACKSYAQAGAGRSGDGSLLFVSDQATTTDDKELRSIKKLSKDASRSRIQGASRRGAYLEVCDPRGAAEGEEMRSIFGQRKEVRSMAKDPVCNMNVDESTAQWTTEHEGQKYYFCAPGCKKTFEENPQKYTGEHAGGCHT